MDTVTLELLLLLVFGLLQLFFGYPLFRVLVVLAGAALGFSYGPALLNAITGRPIEPWMGFSAAIVVAVVLGLLAWLAFWAVVFLWGAALGYGAVDAASQSMLMPLLGGLVVGVLAVVFQRILIVVLTALSGAWLTAYSALTLLRLRPPGTFEFGTLDPWLLVAVLALALVGAIMQFRRVVPTSGL